MEFASRLDLESPTVHEAVIKVLTQAIAAGKSDERMCRMCGIDQAQLNSLRLEIQQRDRSHNQ